MNIEQFLLERFGYEHFRPGQKEIIEAALQKKHVLGVLATGTGKSLCYQFVSEWTKGLTLVISPLISLMEDQVTRLRQRGFKRVGMLHSGLDKERYAYEWEQVQSNASTIVFLSPERLLSKTVLRSLAQLSISLLVVDEAHCVSQWGYDFRPDYLLIAQTYNTLGNPPVMALTGTASPRVQADIIDKLQINDAHKVILSMNRPNIAFYRQPVHDDLEKRNFLLQHLPKLKGPGIIYASTRKQTEQLADWLSEHMDINVLAYHGGLSSEDRITIQTQFMFGQASLLVATNAFGMGIDKDNIQYVIHYNIPTSVENYLQETGRIGRNGSKGIAIVLYNKKDIDFIKSIIDYSIPTPTQIQDMILYLQKGAEITYDDNHFHEYMPLKSIYYRLLQNRSNKSLAILMQIGNDDISESFIQQLSEEWESLRREKHQQIELLGHIMAQSGCLRMQLMHNMEEYDFQASTACCSNCSLDLTTYYLKEHKKAPPSKHTWDWEVELKQLLPIENIQ